MNYNDGKIHTEFYNEDVDRKEIAKQFSEGDEQLEKCLLELWDNGIQTTACCRGHDTNEHKCQPYISLKFNHGIHGLIDNLYNYICLPENRHSIELDFLYNSKNDSFNFSITMDNEQSKQRCLSFISRYLNNHKIDDLSNLGSIASGAKDLLVFACLNNLDCRFGVTNDKDMQFCYTTPGHMPIFDANALQLDDIIDDIKANHNLPLAPISCNENSIKQFLDFIHPKEVNNSKSKRPKMDIKKTHRITYNTM